MVRRRFGGVLIAFLITILASLAGAQASSNFVARGPRIALVVGNTGYAKVPAALALNDAGLVAEALRTVGFDIVEGADVTLTETDGTPIAQFGERFSGNIAPGGLSSFGFEIIPTTILDQQGEGLIVAIILATYVARRITQPLRLAVQAHELLSCCRQAGPRCPPWAQMSSFSFCGRQRWS